MTKLNLTAGFIAKYNHSPEEGYYLIKYSGNRIKRAIYFGESFPPRINGWTCVRYNDGFGQAESEIGTWRHCADEEVTHRGSRLRSLINSLNLPVLQMDTETFTNITKEKPREGYYYRVTRKLIGKPIVSEPYKSKNEPSADGPDTVFLYKDGNWVLVA
ncbi:MAG: hypothetical protein ACOZAO_01660 [Patescibacteria group bacterium]